MPEPIKEEDINGVVVSPSETTEEKEKREGDENEAKGLNRDGTPKQDPLTTELEKVNDKKRTKADKLLYSKKRIDEQLAELGIGEEPKDPDDDTPVTVGMLKKMQTDTSVSTALQLADKITNVTERELVKYHLENTIKSTGDPTEDLKLAQAIVNSAKNTQIIEEAGRKTVPANHSNSSGAPATIKVEEELTPDELAFTKPPFNMSKADILKARPKV